MKYLLMSLPREYFTVLILNANEIPSSDLKTTTS